MLRLPLYLFIAITPAHLYANAPDWCFPKNNLHHEDALVGANANIDQAAFQETINQLTKIYQPIVARHGGELHIEGDWQDGTVNAYADQEGNVWKVAMFGGLARRPEITPDAFTLVVCHELGHHLGGFAFKGERWAASEGQSDYFAAQACARKIWAEDINGNASHRHTSLPVIREQCDQTYTTANEQNLCYRTMTAGLSLTTMLAKMSEVLPPQVQKKDPSVVPLSQENHPASQCRLDTYVQASLCTKQFSDEEIPGKYHPKGQSSIEAEFAAAKNSCTDADFRNLGQRPLCWFKPNLGIFLDVTKLRKRELKGDRDGIWEPGETYSLSLPLINRLQDPIDGLKLSLKSGRSLKSSTYPDAIPDQLVYPSTAISVTAPKTHKCGVPLKIMAAANYGQWSTTKIVEVPMGKFKSLARYRARPNRTIPDNERLGITHTVHADESGQASVLAIHLRIQHPYLSDLRIELTSPKGKKYLLSDRSGSDHTILDKQFRVPLANEIIRGDWKLNIADLNEQDIGIVKAVSLDFIQAQCT